MRGRYLWNINAARFTAFMKHSMLPALSRVLPFLDTGFKYQEDFQRRSTYDEDGKCLFCQLAEQSDSLVYQDPSISAFNDHKGIGACHILVIPRRHIPDALALETDDSTLVHHMWQTGRRLIKEKCPTAEFRFGFHLPPLHSIEHLHLHCIALPSAQPIPYRYSNWLWLLAPQDCLEMLENKFK
jgi:diadenosine tetraphosphate (Ap4A) HIT family hydrolase